MPGLIDLMGTALYSRSDAAIRELIQNAHDGILRKRMQDLSFQGTIRLRQIPESGILQIEDDGIGLSADEAEKYLGTLGLGITGILRRDSRGTGKNDSLGLIGQFGIGLLSAFLLADRIVLESRKSSDAEPIRWEAGNGTEITLSLGSKETVGTTVSLYLRPESLHYADSELLLEEAVTRYADFLGVPILLNDKEQRLNRVNAVWFEPECDEDQLTEELETRFHETPLSVLPIRMEKPVTIQGALYVSPKRLPGFSGESHLTATIRRMIISPKIQGLMPEWAPFVRGILELPDCRPTASREELVRDETFDLVRETLEKLLFEYFEKLADKKKTVWESLLLWHRYMLAGSALANDRLRDLLRKTYPFSTHRGKMTFDEIVEKSPANVLFEDDAEYVIWYHCDRRQEAAMESVFAELKTPCVHATQTFEESLLVAMSFDLLEKEHKHVVCKPAVPGTKGFAGTVLGAREPEPLDDHWEEFFEEIDAKFFVADCDSTQPIFAFLNERHDLVRTLEQLRRDGSIPASFQRMIDEHLDGEEPPRNEILLNRKHDLVRQSLDQKPGMPLPSVLRVLVFQAIQSAGAQLSQDARARIDDDLHWIAETLRGRKNL